MIQHCKNLIQAEDNLLGVNQDSNLTFRCITYLSKQSNEASRTYRRPRMRKRRSYVSTVFHSSLLLLVLFVFAHNVSCQNALSPSVTSPSNYLESQKQANLTCTLRTSATPTNNRFPLSWNRAGGLPFSSTTTSSQQTGSGGEILYQSVLFFTPTAPDNEVRINCNATIGNLSGSFSYLPLVVLVPDQPVITGPDSVNANENSTWTCTSDGASQSAPNVYWRDGKDVALMEGVTKSTTVKVVPNQNRIYVIITTITISLPTAASFNLTCNVVHAIPQDSYSSKKTASKFIVVFYPPVITKNGGNTITTTESQLVSLSCVITSSNPAATNVSWTKDGTPLDLTSGRYGPVSTSSPSLSILSTLRGDRGNYTCTVGNSVGSTSFTTPTTLVVRYPPSVNNTGNQTIVDGSAGGSLIIPCPVDAVPPPTAIRWNRIVNGQAQTINITGNPRYSGGTVVNQQYDLSIDPVQGDDAGSYFCEAVNDLGTGKGPNTTVDVNYNPVLRVPPYVEAKEGDSFNISCRITMYPAVTSVVWLKESTVLSIPGSSAKYSGGTVQNPSLTVQRADKSDSGTYKCQGSNGTVTVSGTTAVNITYLPEITKIGGNVITTNESQQVSFSCVITASNPAAANVSWTKDGSPLNLTSGRYGPVSTSSPSLTILSTLRGDHGNYICTVANSLGSTSFTTPTTLVVTYPPSVNNTGNQTIVDGSAGGSLTIPCPVDAVPPPTAIRWNRIVNGQAQTINITGNPRYSGGTVVNQQYDLTIDPVQGDDAGSYFCEAVNDLGTGKGPNTTVDVNYDPVVTMRPYVEAKEGDSFNISCRITMYPAVTSVVWLKNNTELSIPGSSGKYSGGTVQNPSLTVQRADKSDSGTYKCQGSNGTVTVSGTTAVNITYSPVITKNGGNAINTTEAQQVSLSCVITASNPAAINVSWTKDGTPLDLTSGRYGPVSTSSPSLTILSTLRGDHGNYICTVANSLGSASFTTPTTLVVTYPPSVNNTGNQTIVDGSAGGSLTIPCPVDAVPPPTAIRWNRIVNGQAQTINITGNPRYSGGTVVNQKYDLTIDPVQGDDAGSYFCEAVNDLGTGKGPNTTVDVNYDPVVTVPPYVEAKEGDSFNISCRITMYSVVTSVVWVKGSTVLNVTGSSGKYSGGTVQNPSLTVQRADKSDSGTYKCQGSNGTLTVSGTTAVNITYPPVITKNGGNTTNTREGQQVSLSCIIRASNPAAINVSWTKDGTPLDLTSGRYGPVSTSSPSLTILSTLRGDRGNYICTVANSLGSTSFTTPTTLVVTYPPSVNNTGNQTIVDGSAGGSLTIPCPVDAVPPPTAIRWNRIINGQAQTINITDNPRYSGGTVVNQQYDLTIDPVQGDDAGSYFCEAVNDLGTGKGPNTTVDVNYDPVVTMRPYVEAKEGDSFNISCRITMYPAVTSVVWAKNNTELSIPGSSAKYSGGTVQNPSLTVQRADKSDSGTYKCQGSNGTVTVSGTTAVNITYPPVITKNGGNAINTTEAQQVSLSCVITASNPAVTNVSWTKDGSPLDLTSGRYGPVNTSSPSLTISSALRGDRGGDRGNYICTAANSLGSTSFTTPTTLVVTYPPSINNTGNQTIVDGSAGGSLTIPCPVDAVPPPTAIRWNRIVNGQAQTINITGNPRYSGGTVVNQQYNLTIDPVQGDDAGSYFCEAVNDLGTGKGPNTTVDVNYDPVVTVPPYVEAKEGDSFNISCRITMYSTVTSVVWFKGSTVLNVAGSSGKYSGGTVQNLSLTVQRADKSDSGTYKCQGSNGTLTVSGTTAVNITYPPVITKNGGNTTNTREGQQVSLSCIIRASNPAAANVSWTKDGSPLDLTSGRYGPVSTSSPSLTISSTLRGDRGNYICTAANSLGSTSFTTPTTLVVTYPPSVNNTGNQTIVDGSAGGSLTIPCPVDAVPPPTAIRWNRIVNGQAQTINITGNPRYSGGTVVNQQYDLTIDPVQGDDAGSYFCEAVNDLGTGKGPNTTVDVNYDPVVTMRPYVEAKEGDSFNISCRITMYPAVTSVVWVKDNTELSIPGSSGKYSGGTVQNPSLTVQRADKSDSGTYKCQGSNGTVTVSGTTAVNITYPPEITKIGGNAITTNESQQVSLSCIITSSNPAATNVSWAKDEVRLNLTSGRYGPISASSPSLTILSTLRSDHGNYLCTVANSVGSTSFTTPTTLVVTYPPSVNNTGNQTIVDGSAGGSLTIPCPVDAVPPPTAIRWNRIVNGQAQTINITGNPRYSGGTVVNQQYDLTIDPVQGDDAGSYFCEAVNDLGTGKGPNTTVDVNYDPVVTMPPYVEAKEGDSFNISCRITMYPAVTSVVWLKGSTVLSITGSSGKYSDGTVQNPSLTVQRADKSDSGTYKCQGSNGTLTVSGTTAVNITYAPKLSVSTSDIRGRLGQNATITISIDAVPPATNITWLRQDYIGSATTEVPIGGRISGGSLSAPSLTIANLVPGDTATYYCVVSNSNGRSTSGPISLQVQYKPIVQVVSAPKDLLLGEKFELSCTAVAYPNVTGYAWYQGSIKLSGTGEYTKPVADLADYVDFRCDVTNSIGTSYATIRPNIEFSPHLEGTGKESITAKKSATILLQCLVKANPEPTSYAWYKKDTLITGANQKNFSISLSEDTDFGNYSCSAENILGSLNPARQFTITKDVDTVASASLSTAMLVLIVLIVIIFLIIIFLLVICCCLHGVCAEKRNASTVTPTDAPDASNLNGQPPLPPIGSKPKDNMNGALFAVIPAEKSKANGNPDKMRSPLRASNPTPNGNINLNDADIPLVAPAGGNKLPSTNNRGSIISVPDKTGARAYHLPPIDPEAESTGVYLRESEKRRSRRKKQRKNKSEDKNALTMTEESTDRNSPTT